MRNLVRRGHKWKTKKPVVLTWHLKDALLEFGQEIAYRGAAWLSDTSRPAETERNV